MATSPSAALAPPAAAPRSSKLKIVIPVAVLACGLAGGGGYYLMSQRAPAADAESAAPVLLPDKPIFVTIEPLTVNVQSEGRARFLHVGMALKVRNEQAKAHVIEYMPEVRSRLLLLLSNRPPESLVTTEDRARLAEEIRLELSRPLAAGFPPQEIGSVSFNTFMVQ